jgi:hypothetical protein
LGELLQCGRGRLVVGGHLGQAQEVAIDPDERHPSLVHPVDVRGTPIVPGRGRDRPSVLSAPEQFARDDVLVRFRLEGVQVVQPSPFIILEVVCRCSSYRRLCFLNSVPPHLEHFHPAGVSWGGATGGWACETCMGRPQLMQVGAAPEISRPQSGHVTNAIAVILLQTIEIS